MLNLNLLPPSEKTDLAYELRARAVTGVGFAFVAASLISLVLILPTWFFVEFQRSDVVRAEELSRKQEEQSGITRTEELIRTANRISETVKANLTNRARPSPIIEVVLRELPREISLTTIQYKSQAKELSVSGLSPTRDAFLAFTRGLKTQPEIKDVSSPISNVIHESDIRFSLVITLR